MDITLIRTFLEVGATGSFVAAAKRLFVTQSAVSLRIQKLEDSLGLPLFDRSKAGAIMTPAGREFERYALTLLKVWEEARQQIAVPDGYKASLHIGAQYSLWPRLGFRWLDELKQRATWLSVRAEIGMPDRLTRFLVEGVTQMALMYNPQARPGLGLRPALEDELVLVAGWSNPTLDLSDRYVFVDWGPEFTHAHALHFPKLTNPGVTLALGALAVDFIASRKLAAYLPARAIKDHLDRGELHLIPEAPKFPYPAWVVWREDLDPKIVAVAQVALGAAEKLAEKEQTNVLKDLASIADSGQIATLGDEIEIGKDPSEN